MDKRIKLTRTKEKQEISRGKSRWDKKSHSKCNFFSTGFCQSSVSGGTWYTKNGVPINEYIQKEETGKIPSKGI